MSSKDDWREHRERKQRIRRQQTSTCCFCGLHDGYKIWNTDKKCPRCDSPNPDYVEKAQ